MSATEFHLPDLGEGLREAEIVHWHVQPGDHVVENQPLVSVETDKAVVEIPSPRGGRIARLAAGAGDRLQVGALLVVFDAGVHADTGTVVGELPESGEPKPVPAPVVHAAMGKTRAMPAARKLAAEAGVDLAALAGTGPDGVITREDVDRAVTGNADDWEPLTGVRRSMAENMARAGRQTVPATVTGWADAGEWFRRQSPLPRLVLAVAHAALQVPALNCHFDDRRPARRFNPGVHLGIAMETDDGLLVPVLRDAHSATPETIATALADLEQRAASRSLAPAELRGATISLSNFGAAGGEHAAMVVLPPQVAIVGAGRIGERLRVVDGHIAVRPLLPLSVTIDHRAVTGVEAARFLAALIAHLEQPEPLTND